MNCCTNCFNNPTIISFIKSYASKEGTCDFCNEKNNQLIQSKQLLEYFQQIFEEYIPIKEADLGDHPKYTLVERFLYDYSNVFNIESPEIILRLLRDIFVEESKYYDEYFQDYILPRAIYSDRGDEKNKEQSLLWDGFADEIKSTNRFHLSNAINLDLTKRLIKRHTKTYKQGHLFYRGRLSNKEGFPSEKMGPPPPEKAKGGRSNPEGIPYLYLANDLETTLYEARASLFDYVTVGIFELTKDVEVVCLRDIGSIDPFEVDDLSDFLEYREYLNRLEDELRKPIRKTDSDLDYLPTQYLSEFIKVLGFEGIEYGSSLNPKGYNLAFFKSDLFSCIDRDVYDINSIKYEFENLR